MWGDNTYDRVVAAWGGGTPCHMDIVLFCFFFFITLMQMHKAKQTSQWLILMLCCGTC